ncbi:hypothetical protein D3Z58_18775 [Clostridiaceae bacterium]|nr:hypothetical protein [Clostridiaceae bacterium]
MHHHLAVPNKAEKNFRYAGTKENFFLTYLIGRKPDSETKSSCTAARSHYEQHPNSFYALQISQKIFVVPAQKKIHFKLI